MAPVKQNNPGVGATTAATGPTINNTTPAKPQPDSGNFADFWVNSTTKTAPQTQPNNVSPSGAQGNKGTVPIQPVVPPQNPGGNAQPPKQTPPANKTATFNQLFGLGGTKPSGS